MSELKSFKRLNGFKSRWYTKVLIGGEVFREYKLSDLPAKFGCINWNRNEPMDEFSEPSQGIDSWMKDNKRGFIYVNDEQYFSKGW